MILITLLTLTMLLISLILVILTLIISKKSKNLREKWTPFECGFNFFNSSRMPFSMRFFLIAIIFIIFDVEIALILPLIPTIFKANIFKWTLTSIFFMIILILGILMEWKENTFEWKN
uniref:NADH dehydrogenase subunit 3 n=1 Tax=Mycterothrips gongshanensis TaxID=2792509 RepID=UPI00220E249B|nr:NADH dehydrogenase subunit 3 [Mycterothrips gongshanensis]UXW64204.1 NADH dehydrogenase subunit 3 [Mycterothrips gongshanensis]